MSTGSDPLVARKHFRTRAGNGNALYAVKIDERGLFCRRDREIRNQIAIDLGGADRLSELQMALVRRASALCILCELTEIELAQGSRPEIQEYLTTVNVLRRVSAALGLARVPRDIVPPLESYFASRYSGDASEDAG